MSILVRRLRILRAMLPGVFAAMLCLSVARADTLVTQSGQRFEGKVMEDGDRYILATPNGGKMTFAKNLVREIIRSDKPAPSPTADGAATVGTSPSAAVNTAPKATLFMEIPIVGEFGKDILPEGVELCLRYCSQDPSIKHIVFRINSQGGKVAAADKILVLMQRYDERFDYHALIEEAMSAAIWVVFACDTIHMADSASVGGAVPFYETASGSTAVDAKMASLIAAKMAALASAKGHLPVVAKAMIIQACEAYVWKQGDEVIVSEVAPSGVAPTDLIVRDTPQTVLTLTRDQAVAIGLAKPIRGGCDALGASLGLPGWRKSSNYTESVMSRTKLNREKAAAELAAARRKNDERTTAVIALIESNSAEAVANDPGNFTYYYDSVTGYLTADSAQRWLRQSDMAIAAWQRVQSGLVEFRKLEKEAEQLGMQRVIHDLNLADLYSRAGREINRLLSERRRMTP